MTSIRRLVIDLDPGSSPLRGELSLEAGDAVPFTGWLELSAMIDAASEENAPVLTIRDAQPSDAPAIRAIGLVAFPGVNRGYMPEFVMDAVLAQTYSVEALERKIAQCAADPASVFLVAAEGEEVVGFLHYETESVGSELKRLYLRPDRKGGGIGTRLVEALHARLTPGDEYLILVTGHNAGGQGFYEATGCELVRDLDGRDFYTERMGVQWPPGTPEVPCRLYRRIVPG